MTITPCITCGYPIEQPAKGRHRKYCSNTCGAVARRSIKCMWKDCDVVIVRGPGKPNRFCSDGCRAMHKAWEKEQKSLVVEHCRCGNVLEQPKRGRKRKYCSDECKANAAKVNSYKEKCAWRLCKSFVLCGLVGGQRKYCSDRCRRLDRRWGRKSDMYINGGYVYIIKNGSGKKVGHDYKIGKSKDVNRRLSAMKSAHQLTEDSVVLKTIFSKDPSSFEIEMHSRFAHRRTYGEFFSLSDSDVEFIQSMSDET